MAPPRGEPFPVVDRWGAAPLAKIDRTATNAFGLISFGQHVNGMATDAEGALHLWIGRRADDRRVAPGKYDNLIAGGLPYGLTLAEEPGEGGRGGRPRFGADLVALARPVGAISYRMSVPEGLRRDVLFCYDLPVPAGVEPRNADGEVAEFRLWPLEEVAEALAAGDGFKFNVALVILDFMIRHGALGPDHPEYLDLLAGFHGGGVKLARPEACRSRACTLSPRIVEGQPAARPRRDSPRPFVSARSGMAIPSSTATGASASWRHS